MKHSTTIDTIGIQIDCNDAYTQRDILNSLLGFTLNLNSIYLNHKDHLYGINMLRREHYIYSNNTTIATINTGIFRTGKHKDNTYRMQYYISIKFAGLKTYNHILDKTSHDYLERVCAYLNTRGMPFKLTELDICIDIKCPFEHVLSICTKKSPKTNYYTLYDTQAYATTSYIENITNKKLTKAVLRAYTYDKSYKEKLPYPMTRFELKLQPKYFNKYGFSITSIENALDRYYVMYFNSEEEKYSIITAYNAYQTVRKREVKKLELNRYRLFADVRFIDNFLKRLLSITELDLYNSNRQF